MEVLSWGDMILSVDPSRIYTFNGLSWTMGYTSKTKDLKKKKPKTTAKAPNLEQISFDVTLCRDLGVDVMSEINAWRAACNAGTSSELYIGGSRIGDEGTTWRIKSLNCSDIVFDGAASAYKTKIAISMDEVANPPKKVAAKKKKKKKKKATKTVPRINVPRTVSAPPSQTAYNEYRQRRGF